MADAVNVLQGYLMMKMIMVWLLCGNCKYCRLMEGMRDVEKIMGDD
jgi:hypothetical protein